MQTADPVVLVIECQSHLNWRDIFAGAQLEDGTKLSVEQATWDDVSLVSWPEPTGVRATLRNGKSFRPAHVLIRSVSRGTWTQDSSNKLMALAHGDVPCTNSAFSCHCFLEKPIVWGELKKIQKRLGVTAFPLIEQTMYPSYREMSVSPDLPCVGKTGSAHAGKGKIKIATSETFEDYASLVALQPYFSTCEKFINWDWDGRVQKIGPHYRVFSRKTGTWKGNSGRGAIIEELPVTPEYKLWADECAKLFGGIEILGLDFVHERETGKIIILELNDTAIGLLHRNEIEDMGFMRDLVVAKMNQAHREAVKPEADQKNLEVLALQEQVRRLIVEKIKLAEQIAK